MRPYLKSTSKTLKTFTMKFEFSTQEELKKLKALSILLGNYNPLRNEMINEDECYKLKEEIQKKGELDWILTQLSRQLK